MKIIAVFATLICLVMVSSALAGDPDLVFYFSYDGVIDGDTITGESDNALVGTIMNKADQVDAGKRGKAMKFETGSYIDLDGPNVPEGIIPRAASSLMVSLELSLKKPFEISFKVPSPPTPMMRSKPSFNSSRAIWVACFGCSVNMYLNSR